MLYIVPDQKNLYPATANLLYAIPVRTLTTSFNDNFTSINYDEKCPYNDDDSQDGVWDIGTGEYIENQCKRRDCPRHWRRYGKRLLRRLPDKVEVYEHVRHLVILTGLSPKKGDDYRWLDRLAEKLIFKLNLKRVIAVFHMRKKVMHVHLALYSDDILDDDNIRAAAHITFRGDNKARLKNLKVCLIKGERHPLHILRYFILGRWRQPRQLPPWLGLPRRPYAVFKARKNKA